MKAIIWSALAIAGWAGASPITFTISTTGSGTLGALAFSDATIVFTAVTDTTFILNGVPNQIGDAGSATSSPQNTFTVSILALGSWLLTDPVDFFDDRTKGFAGFQDLNETLDVITDLLDESDPAFSTYDLKTSLGPISDSIANGTGIFTSVPTTGGTLAFTTNSTNASFQAVGPSSVPEPGSLGLMLAGAMVVGFKIVRSNPRSARLAI
jgi:hypothetical protein